MFVREGSRVNRSQKTEFKMETKHFHITFRKEHEIMEKSKTRPMELRKCRSCGRYHFAIGYVTLSLNKEELSVMGKLIDQALIKISRDEFDVSKDIGLLKRANLMMN